MTWWCRITGTAALAGGAVTVLELLFPAPETEALHDRMIGWAALTVLLTALWWVGALLAPPLTAPPVASAPGPVPVPARVPRRRATRATLLPSLFLVTLPLVVVRVVGAHAGPLKPVMPAFTLVAALASLTMLRFWLKGLAAGGGARQVRRDLAAGEAVARRVRVGRAVWTRQGGGSWSASRRLELSADDATIALRAANEESPQFPWLDLESAGVLEGREGWLCWALTRSGGTDEVAAALVTDDGHVVWGATGRQQAQDAWTPGEFHPTAPRRVRRAPRASLYRPDVHRYGLAMAAVTLLALALAERGVLPDPLSWCLALLAAFTGARGVFGFTGRLAGRPGPGWRSSASGPAGGRTSPGRNGERS